MPVFPSDGSCVSQPMPVALVAFSHSHSGFALACLESAAHTHFIESDRQATKDQFPEHLRVGPWSYSAYIFLVAFVGPLPHD